MKIALTGGTGGVGVELGLAALSHGHQVSALVRDAQRAHKLEAAGARLVTGSLDDAPALASLVGGADVVMHTAAMVGEGGSPREHELVNVEGTRALLEAAGRARVPRFVHLSSVAVYGMPELGTVDETFPFVATDEPYALTKRAAEELVFRRGAELGMQVSAVRPPIIFGKYDRVFLPRAIEALRAGRAVYVDGGRAPLNVVSASDVVDVMLRCAKSPAAVGQAFNVAAWPPPSQRDVLDTIADAAGAPRPRLSLPKGVALTVARAWELAAKLRNAPAPPLTTFVVRRFTRYVVYDASKARRLLGWSGGERPLDEIAKLTARFVSRARGQTADNQTARGRGAPGESAGVAQAESKGDTTFFSADGPRPG